MHKSAAITATTVTIEQLDQFRGANYIRCRHFTQMVVEVDTGCTVNDCVELLCQHYPYAPESRLTLIMWNCRRDI